jgi:hypothetical protein
MATITMEQILTAVESGDYVGICVGCGNEQEGVEPDARRYECESCGKHKVFGAEELLMMGGGWMSPSNMEALI